MKKQPERQTAGLSLSAPAHYHESTGVLFHWWTTTVRVRLNNFPPKAEAVEAVEHLRDCLDNRNTDKNREGGREGVCDGLQSWHLAVMVGTVATCWTGCVHTYTTLEPVWAAGWEQVGYQTMTLWTEWMFVWVLVLLLSTNKWPTGFNVQAPVFVTSSTARVSLGCCERKNLLVSPL